MTHLNTRFNLFLAWLMLIPILMPVAGASAYDRRTAVVEAIQRVAPAVVNISSEYRVQARSNPFSGFGMDPFFDSFFKDFFDPGFEKHAKRTSLGSGVIIDGDRGFILTNAHVITQSESISVVLQDGHTYTAQIVGSDPDSDLAVLKIETDETLPAVAMGRSDDLMIGETVIAIGNPFGFSHTVTTGVVSALNRSVRTDDAVFHDFIQTDASINPGNSGGPLLNINGELVGINTAIYAKAQGIGFAIPIDKASRIVSDLIQYGEVVLSWTGMLLQDLDENLARYLNVPGNKGVVVKSVEPASPAMKADIRKGDVLLSIEEAPVPSVEAYRRILRNYQVGSEFHCRLLRRNSSFTVLLKTELFPEEKALALAEQLLGIYVEDLSAKNRGRFRLSAKKGIVITEVTTGSYLDSIGVKPGDVIRRVDDMTIDSVADFKKAMVKIRPKKSIVILVQRWEQGYYISVKL